MKGSDGANKIDRQGDPRFEREIKAKYSLKNYGLQYNDCTMINISLSGACIQFDKFEAFTIGSKIFLEIFIPESLNQIKVTGEVRWIAQKEYRIICGIKFDKMLDPTRFAEFI
jgi:Tfp pilus assembly protein PilZ